MAIIENQLLFLVLIHTTYLEYTFLVYYIWPCQGLYKRRLGTKYKDKLSDEMRRFSKILVAVDGSEPSMLAADCAMEMAKKHNAQLIALTVAHIPLSSYGFGSRPDAIKQNKEKRALEAKEWFLKLEEAGTRNNVSLKTELIDSRMSVEGTIVEYAESQGIDLIVIGTTGRSGFKKLLLGSVALGVVNYATCSVMVIK